ncbi:MAG: hypothetical protein ACK6D3_26125 [Planctomycetaceae bacterium]
MPRHRLHPLFVLSALAGFAFCVTSLALVFTPWMEPPSPFVRWLETNAFPLLASEIAVILIAGSGAMLFDTSPPAVRAVAPAASPADASVTPASNSAEPAHEPQSPPRD